MVFSKISIQIDNLKISSEKKKHINDEYKIIIKIYAFSKIPILRVVYDKNKMKKLEDKINLNKKIKNLNVEKIIEEIKKKNKTSIKVIKLFFKYVLEIININLKIKVGTKNSASTAILVGILSTIIAIVLKTKVKDLKKQFYKIIPVYLNENLFNIEFSGIFQFKLIHIINIIFILVKEEKECKKYERTSNRKHYGYSNEQYPRYD